MEQRVAAAPWIFLKEALEMKCFIMNIRFSFFVCKVKPVCKSGLIFGFYSVINLNCVFSRPDVLYLFYPGL